MPLTRCACLGRPPGSSARIARGTLEGLSIIEALRYKGQTLSDFLTRFYGTLSRESVTAIVTGHSLGGCLATVVAPWMRALLPDKITIQPITFAAPTAGDEEFAAYYT